MFDTKDTINFLRLLNIKWHSLPFDINQLTKGLNIELEHGSKNILTNITNDDLLMTGKIALAHLMEDPEYYTKLELIHGGYTEDRLLEEKPYPESYPSHVKDLIKLISFNNKDGAHPFGSYIYRVQRYAGDIDTFEIFEKPTEEELINSFAINFKRVVSEILKKRMHYITDIKAGVDDRFNVNIGILENNIYTPDIKALSEHIGNLRKYNLISNENINKIAEILLKDVKDSNDYDIIYNILREYYILRWTPQEILRGYKILPGNKQMSLKEAITKKAHVKIDMVTLINNRFVEITNFIFLTYERPGQLPCIINFNKCLSKQFFDDSVIIQLPGEVEKLFYSNYHKNYFKGIKRLWVLARRYKDTDMIRTLEKFISGNISALYQIKSEIDTIILVLSKNLGFPIENIKSSLQNIKMNLTYVLEFDKKQLLSLSRYIDDITNRMNKSYVIYKLERLSEYFKGKINYYTMRFLEENNLWPIPEKYLPKRYKYISMPKQYKNIPSHSEDVVKKLLKALENRNINRLSKLREQPQDIKFKEQESEQSEDLSTIDLDELESIHSFTE